MPDFNKIYLYRITHIKNIPHIIKYGITHSTSLKANPDFVPIGDNSLISSRKKIKFNNKLLGDYIPFYFAIRTPMLYVIQNGLNMVSSIPAEDIVYCVSSIQKILDQGLDFIYTDGHAVNKLSSLYSKNDINEIENKVDFKAIKKKYWNQENDLDLKRRKEAEFLVVGDIEVNSILGYVVYNEHVRNKMISYGVNAAHIKIDSKYYF